MKKDFSKFGNIVILIIVITSFFPWRGLLNQTGLDIMLGVLKHVTTLASVEAYAISVGVISASVALLLALVRKGNALFSMLTFVAFVSAFIFGLINSNNYLSSMHPAYVITLFLSVVMLLRKFGIIRR